MSKGINDGQARARMTTEGRLDEDGSQKAPNATARTSTAATDALGTAAKAGPKAAPKASKSLRLIVAGIVVVAVLVVALMRGDQLEELLGAVSEASPAFLAAAVLAQLGKYAAQGEGFVRCFHSTDATIGFRHGLALVFGAFFVNTIAPSLNLAGTSLVVDTSLKRGISAGKATGAALLMQLCTDSGFVCIMLIAFAVLGLTVGLQPGWLLLGLAAAMLVGSLAVVMVVGGLRPDLALRVLKPIERLADKVLRKLKREPIEPWAQRMVGSFSEAARQIAHTPKRALAAFAFSLAASTCEIACFSLVGAAFGIHNLEALVCGYVLATLFAMISVVPQGVGVVEAAVTVGFNLFGVNAAAGLAAVMVYRSIVFWLPFLVGAIVVGRLGARR